MDTHRLRVQGIYVMSVRHTHMLHVAEVDLAHPCRLETAVRLEQELVPLLRKEQRV
jgi:hypothetical protein